MKEWNPIQNSQAVKIDAAFKKAMMKSCEIKARNGCDDGKNFNNDNSGEFGAKATQIHQVPSWGIYRITFNQTECSKR